MAKHIFNLDQFELESLGPDMTSTGACRGLRTLLGRE